MKSRLLKPSFSELCAVMIESTLTILSLKQRSELPSDKLLFGNPVASFTSIQRKFHPHYRIYQFEAEKIFGVEVYGLSKNEPGSPHCYVFRTKGECAPSTFPFLNYSSEVLLAAHGIEEVREFKEYLSRVPKLLDSFR